MSTTEKQFPELFQDGVFQHLAGNKIINFIAGNDPVSKIDNTEESQPVFSRQLGLITEEFKELVKGFAESNVKEIRDGLADVIVTTDGMFHRMRCGYIQAGWSRETGFLDFDDTHLETVRNWLLKMSSPTYLQDAFAADANASEYRLYADAKKLSQFADIVSIMRRYSLLFGINPDVDQQTVFESNLSKFDTSIEKAQLTVDKYTTMGVEVGIFPRTYGGVQYHVVKSIKDQVVNDVSYPQGKFLKSVDYIPPQWTPLSPDALLLKMFSATA